MREWVKEAEASQANEELSRIQEEFNMAFANEHWNQVVDLYQEHDFLKAKCSNSTMFHKAKRFIKLGATSAPMVDSPEIVKDPSTKSVDLPQKTQKNKKRPLGTRPNVTCRLPRTEKNDEASKVKDNKVEHVGVNPIQTDDTRSAKSGMKIYQKKFINKPKR